VAERPAHLQGLSVDQQALLFVVEGCGPVTANEVVRCMGWTLGSSLRLLSSLQDRGLLRVAILPGSSLWWRVVQ
jgi:hypothetical protein